LASSDGGGDGGDDGRRRERMNEMCERALEINSPSMSTPVIFRGEKVTVGTLLAFSFSLFHSLPVF
jgi:hypothetical protein